MNMRMVHGLHLVQLYPSLEPQQKCQVMRLCVQTSKHSVAEIDFSLSPGPERFHILLRVPPGGNRVTWKLGFRCQLNSIYNILYIDIYIHVSTRLAVVPVDKKHCEQSILKCEVLYNTTHLSDVENPV